MASREWVKPAVYGALGGAVLTMVLGFSWGGWVTGGSAQAMAVAESKSAVVAALVPVCLQMSQNDPDRLAKLTLISEAPTYQRRDKLIEAGWATAPGAETPNRDLAQACIASLDLSAT
jgi:pimeloyl-ACP methyl ester carboxylesterase